MGYDVDRFQGTVDDELICPICSGILEDPVQAPGCEHAFCRRCINEWISRQPTCPIDRQPIESLTTVPRILRNLLSRLSISCENFRYGCTAVLKLDVLESHLLECEHNPKKPVTCEQGCGLTIPMDELKDHNCVRELRSLISVNNRAITELRCTLQNHTRQIDQLVEFVRQVRSSNVNVSAIATSIALTDERDEIIRWSNSLGRAKVTRWGGMISTPDEILQSLVKQALYESGCPAHIVLPLMERCHEHAWPPGLSSLDTRQMNRRQYELYVCKRIPGRQAVVVLQCDNPNMSNDMMVDPGLILIFAHGIE